MSSAKRRRSVLHRASLIELQQLGLLEAERDRELHQYYVGRDQFVDRALDLYDPAAVFVGRKGVGKSAILQMVRLDRSSDSERVINVSPDDLAFHALANIEQTSPLLQEAGRHQHLFKVLWDYVLCIEVAKREYKNENRLVELFKKITRGQDEKVIRRLVRKTLDDTGTDRSLSRQLLDLVQEVEISVNVGGAAGKARAGLRDSPSQRDQMAILAMLNDVAQAVTNGDVLKSEYYILIDDLDLHWKGSDLQKAFVGALLVSVRRLSHAPRIKFIVALRDYIFEAIPLSDKDKFRDMVCTVEWDERAVKEMIEERIRVKLGCTRACYALRPVAAILGSWQGSPTPAT